MISTKQSFEQWNEQMYQKHGNESRYKSTNFVTKWIANKRNKIILKLLNIQPTDKVLDLGCGAGVLISKMNKTDMIVGIDLSQQAIYDAQANNKRTDVDFIKRDIQDLELLEDETFNKIVCSEALEHTEKPIQVIENARRLAKDDATIIFTIPNTSFINSLQGILRPFKFLFKNYDFEQEWHLQDDMALLILLGLKLQILKEVKSPSKLFPYNHIFLCKKKQ